MVCVCVCVERNCGINKRNTSQGNVAEVSNVHMKTKEKKKLNIISQYRNATVMKTTCLYTSTQAQSLSHVQLHCEPMELDITEVT